MKRHVGIISVLIFTIIVLSYSFAAAGFWEDLAKGLEESAKTDTQKKKEAQKKEEEEFNKEFDKKLNGLLKKLPAAARVAVLEIKMKAPEFETPESDPEDEGSRKKIIKSLELIGEKLKDGLEEELEKLGVTVVDRDIFKDIEKEIEYSQTGEVEPSTSAKFGKKAGATHLLIGKIMYDGFKTGHPTATFSIKITEIESAKRIGSINFTQELNIDQLKESTTTTSTPQTKKSTASEPQDLLSEGFSVSPGSYKTYSWDFPNDGTLDIAVKADFDVYVLVFDETNYRVWDSGEPSYTLADKKITSGSFSVSIPRGSHYIIIYNKDSLLTSASVGMVVSFTPR